MLSAMKDSYQAVGIYNQGPEFISPVGQGEEIGKAFLQKRCLGSDSRIRISQTKKKKKIVGFVTPLKQKEARGSWEKITEAGNWCIVNHDGKEAVEVAEGDRARMF